METSKSMQSFPRAAGPIDAQAGWQGPESAGWMMGLALLAAGLPMLLPVSIPPVSTMLNQACAGLGFLLWLLVWGAEAAGRMRRPVGPAAATLVGVLLALAAVQWWTSAPWGQRVLPSGSLVLAAVLAWAGARGALSVDGFARPLLVALLAAALLSCVVAAVQVFAPQWADGHLVAFPTGPGRAVGNMRQPNQLSTLLLWGCAAAVGVGVLRGWSMAVLGAVLTLLVAAVVLTASRTGMVGVGMLALWGAVDRRLPGRVRLLMLLAVPLYFLGWWAMEQWSAATGDFFYGDDQVKKTLHGDPSSSRGRIWANTLSLIAAHPWRGVGPGAFNFVWSMTPFPGRPVAFFDHSHNLPMQLAVESGVPFAVLVLAALGWAFWRARAALRVADAAAATTARVLAFMLAVVGVHSLLEYPLWYAYFLLPTALMAGCLCGAAQGRPAQAAPVSRGGSRWLVGFAAAGLVGWAWMAGQYYRVAIIFDPALAFGEAAPLDERITDGQRSVVFGHHADYARATMAEQPQTVAHAFGRTAYHLLDTRLMMAYAKALAGRGQLAEARHVAARLREFNNPASQAFFDECETAKAPLPFQCEADARLPAQALRPEVALGKPAP